MLYLDTKTKKDCWAWNQISFSLSFGHTCHHCGKYILKGTKWKPNCSVKYSILHTSSCHKPMTQSIFLPSAYQTELKGETDFPMHFLYKGVSRHINYQKRFPKMFRGGAIRFISVVCKRLECATGMCESIIKTIDNDTS